MACSKGHAAQTSGIREMLVEMSRVSKQLSRHDEQKLHHLVECLKQHLKNKCLALVQTSQGMPVLYSHSADATPLKCSTTAVVSSEGASLTRKAKLLHEFLVQRGVVKTRAADNSVSMAFLFADTVPMSAGKKAWNYFSAGATFFPLLRNTGHRGICVQHHSADRAAFDAIDKAYRQRHQAYYTPGMGPDLGPEGPLLELTDWILGSACSCHDLQNGLKWSLSSLWSGQVIQDLHICMEALRNSFETLLGKLPAFLSQHLAFHTEHQDPDKVMSFWRAVGIEADMLERVCEISPWFADGFLWVSAHLAEDEDAIAKVTFVLVYMCQWRRFCDSRWVTIGPSCRPLLWCLCIGLEQWVSLTRSDPGESDYHLHGFSRLSPTIKKCAAVASISANVTDAVLTEALLDDRLVRRAAELKQVMLDEVLWVQGIDSFVWDRLATVVGAKQTGVGLANAAIHASYVQVAFAKFRVFNVLEAYPWSLAVGDIEDNLDDLAATDSPISDPTTQKIRVLLQQGYNRKQVALGVALFREVSFSTVAVEQAHASAACIHKYHPAYESLMLSTRATLHQSRHLFLTPPGDRVEAKAAGKLATMKQKSPFKASGSNAFLASLMEQGRMAMPEGSKLPRAFVDGVVRQHHAWFNALSLEDQAAFHAAARAQAESRLVEVMGDIAHFQDAMHLRKTRAAEELRNEGVKNSVTLARFSTADYESLEAMMSDPTLPTGAALRSLREAKCSPPESPPPHVIEALQQCPTVASPVPLLEFPGWVKGLCWQRKNIVGTAYGLSFEPGSQVFYFLFASQSPLAAHFLPVTVGEPLWPAMELLSPTARLDAWQEHPAFLLEYEAQDIISGDLLPEMSEAAVKVLPGLTFQPGGSLATDFQPVALSEFMGTLPGQESGRSERSSKPPAPSKASLKQAAVEHPWLHEFLPPARRPHLSPSGSSAPASSSGRGPEDPTPEHALSGVWRELDLKRQQWAVETAGLGDDFTTVLRGGPWTQSTMGKATDRCTAQAKSGTPTRWCQMYGLNKIASFSFSVYGEVAAAALSAEWCKRMQFFFDLWLDGPDDFAYRPEDRQAYRPSDRWLRFVAALPNHGKARQRAEAIETLFPGR